MKTVLITGSSRGLGENLAYVFAKNCHQIILHGRDEIALSRIQSIIQNNNVPCHVVIGDLADRRTIEKLIQVSNEYNLDILINNAGTYHKGFFIDTPTQELKRILDINLVAPACLIHGILPIFQNKQSGLIININSIAGKLAGAQESIYSASKHGLRGLSTSLQLEVTSDGIQIIDVYIGAILTQMSKDRENSEMFIDPAEAASVIFGVSQTYQSLRISEIHLNRKIY